jgi:hypothetical protein
VHQKLAAAIAVIKGILKLVAIYKGVLIHISMDIANVVINIPIKQIGNTPKYVADKNTV